MRVNTSFSNDSTKYDDNNQTMVSPMNASGTSISALTFDESIFNCMNMKGFSHRFEPLSTEQGTIVRNPRLMQKDPREIKCNRNENVHTFAKGTLLGRIMQQLNQQSNKQENCETNCTYSNDQSQSESNPQSMQQEPNKPCTLDEAVATDEYDAKMVDASSIHEISLSSCETNFDEWREVQDKMTGRTYYYNRRTRKSTWMLPLNAVVTRRRDRRGDHNDTHFLYNSNEIYEEDALEHAQHPSDSHSLAHCKEIVPLNISSIEETQENCANDHDSSSVNLKPLFCPYCGDKNSLASLSHHLNICKERNRFEEHRPDIGRTIVQALIGSDSPQPKSDYQLIGSDDHKTEFKKEVGVTMLEVDEKDNRQNVSFADVFATNRKRLVSTNIIPSPKKVEHMSRDISSCLFDSDCEEELLMDNLYCSCPFCRRPFKTGDKLSRHLLCCRKRRSSTRKRRSGTSRHNGLNHNGIQDTRNVSSPSLQTALITDGGRSLPGHPKLIRSPLQHH